MYIALFIVSVFFIAYGMVHGAKKTGETILAVFQYGALVVAVVVFGGVIFLNS